jgi:hypothetical protein
MDKENRIRVRAYDIWVAEGCPEGRDSEHWQQAAAEIEASIADGEQVSTSAAGDQPIPKAATEPASKKAHQEHRIARSD